MAVVFPDVRRSSELIEELTGRVHALLESPMGHVATGHQTSSHFVHDRVELLRNARVQNAQELGEDRNVDLRELQLGFSSQAVRPSRLARSASQPPLLDGSVQLQPRQLCP